MLDCVTIGDIKLDTFIRIPEASVMCELKNPECKMCLDYGRKIPTEAFVTQIAGSAPNVATGLARLGLKTGVISSMGLDDTFEHAKLVLLREKVTTEFITAEIGFRSPAAVVLNYQGESTQLVDHGQRDHKLPKIFPKTRAVHVSELGDGYEELFDDLRDEKSANDFLLSLNPGAVQIKEAKPAFFELLKVTDILFVNMVEARKILNVVDNVSPDDLLAKLHALGPGTVVITDGAHGCYASNGTTSYATLAFPSRFFEATGAGDAFATGFLGAQLLGLSLPEALTFGAVEAASVVEHLGPTTGLVTLEELETKRESSPFSVQVI